MGSQEHPHLDGQPTPAIPPPQDPAGDSLEPQERVQTIEGSPSDPHDGHAVGDGRLTNPHGARYRPRPKNVPVSAPRYPVPSPGGSRGGPGSTGRGARNNSRRSNAASICSGADRTPRGPSPAAHADSPSNRSGATRGAADTSGSCGPFHDDRSRRIRRDAGEGSVKVHAGGSEPGGPRMSRVARLERIPQPAARLVLQSGMDEIKIVRVLGLGGFRLEQQDNLGCEERNAGGGLCPDVIELPRDSQVPPELPRSAGRLVE